MFAVCLATFASNLHFKTKFEIYLLLSIEVITVFYIIEWDYYILLVNSNMLTGDILGANLWLKNMHTINVNSCRCAEILLYWTFINSPKQLKMFSTLSTCHYSKFKISILVTFYRNIGFAPLYIQLLLIFLLQIVFFVFRWRCF